ncbi:MAG TPA: carboxypeptidase regulatory-like domain-containing protein [Terracidiphilus sp.]|nr:carboxypeptidase regulatory-like domain-containing protein [Terracidiphilus sp.]
MSNVSGKFAAASYILLAILTLANVPRMLSQAVSIASVTGRIVDPSGAVVVGAQVKITAVDTALVHVAVTDAGGAYSFPSLTIGAYTLEVTAPGFQTYVQKGLKLRVNDALQINVSMRVGEVTKTVEVEADATMVQTQQNMVSQVMDQQRIVELPLNGRDPTQLITISGAAVNHSDGTNTGNKSFYTSQSIAIAGSAGDTTNYLLDGGDNNDSFTNVNMPFPFPDALAEFSVETSVLPARNGLHPGGVVNAVTKSGSNQWHGDFFEFVRNGDVNAINYFAPKQDSLKRNQFGGTFGGRIIPNKLFFFGGIQETIVRQNPSGSSAFIPTTAALNGDFSALDGAGCQTSGVARAIVDPATGTPLTNDFINPNRFDPAAVAFMKYIPVSSANSCGKISYGVPVIYNARQYVTRVDWTINAKHSLYGRYLQDNYDQPAPWSATNYLYTTTLGLAQRPQTFVLGETYAINASTLNSFHFTFGRKYVARFPNTNGIDPAKLGVQNIYTPPLATDNLQMSISSSFNTGGSGFSKWGVNSWQEADDVDVVRGKHQMAFGGEVIRTQDNQNDEYNDSGTFSFNGQYSHDPLLDFLTGTMNNFTQTLQQDFSYRQTLVELYAQDTIRLTPRLVANIGLRWEPTLPSHDYFNRGSVFSLAGFTAGKVSQVFTNGPAGQYFYGDKGVTKSFTADHWLNLSPRIGFIFDPHGDGKTTIRVGGAVLFDSLGTFLTYRVSGQNAPWGATVSETSGPYQFSNPWGNVAGGNPFPLPLFPPHNYTFPLSASDLFLPSQDLPPTTKTWNLGVQHQFAENWIASVTYLGNETSHLMIGNEINPAVYIPGTCGSSACSTTKNTQARRFLNQINPNQGKYFSSMTFADEGISANYEGMLASIEHRLADNYTILANYTWSKCMGVDPVTSLGGAVIMNPANPREDYGPCSYDVPNIFNVSVVYFSHYGHPGLVSYLLKDWQIAPLMRYETGFPVTPRSGLDNSLTGIGLDRPNVVPGAAKYSSSPRSSKLFQWVNPAAFTQNAAGTFGNAGHFSLRTPSYFDVDAAISRTFKATERISIDARVEAFNVTNHPNFGGPTPSTGVGLGPNLTLSSSSFGRITTAGDQRIMQGALKVIF